MNKYIVAHLNVNDNKLTQTLVEETSERAAMLKYLAQYQDVTFDEQELLNMESAAEVVEMCFNFDTNISVYKI